MKHAVVIAVAFFAVSLGAHAEERYSMTKLSDGTVRIDHRTGAISYCREKDGNMICSLAAEERQAWITETQDLSNRIDTLEKRIAALEGKPVPPAAEGKTDPRGSEDQREMDKALDFMEKAIRRFSEVFDDLKGDLNKN